MKTMIISDLQAVLSAVLASKTAPRRLRVSWL
jgi:hypothetical protein